MSGLTAQRGFAEPARQSQQIFRAAMDAMARPGTIKTIALGLSPPAPLTPGMAALALTLLDYETSVWLDGPLATSDEVARYLRFHTGASLAASPAKAAFALIAAPEALPPLERFALGTDDYPDRSTTLLVQTTTLRDDQGWTLSGAGVRPGGVRLLVAPLPGTFRAERGALQDLFPRGIDCFFLAAASLAALPRTTVLKD
jgi:alpha-D-ribose 1-methylphosphonate 5-triphosphate synthase subunit PhnH